MSKEAEEGGGGWKMEGGREGGREGMVEGEREGGREGGREEGREGWRAGERKVRSDHERCVHVCVFYILKYSQVCFRY